MEKNINWDDFTPVSSGNADDVNWSDFSPVNAQESGALSDLGKSLKSGVQKLPGIVTGLADLPAALLTGYRPFTEAADWMGEATGFQPGKWAKDTKFSQGHEDSRKEVDAAWQDGSAADIAKAYISNPNYTLNQVVESLPSMAAGGYASKALMGAGAAAGVVGDAAAGVATKAATPGLLARTVGEKWAAPVAGGAGEGAVTAGQQMDDYTGEDQQKNAWASLGAGAGTGLIGVGAGRLANHLGFETAETAMAKIGQRETVDAAEAAARAAGNGTPDVPLSAKRRILGGMVSEGLLQELPQSAQEQMWQNYANDKPLMEGVTRAGVEGALAGVVMGAGANVRGQGNPPRTVEEIEQQVSELPEHQQNAARATLNAQLQAEARMAGLAEEEQGQQDVPPGNPNDYRATPAWAKPPQDAEQDFGNYDDEILQSTGMEQRPTPHPVRTAVQDAADAGGGLSAAAGLAMDSGITPIPAYMPPAIQEQPAEPEAAQVVLQNRDRTSAASIAQMQEIAANPDYLQVGPSRDMASGAPVVFGDLPGTALLGRPERVVDGTGQRVSAQYAVVDAGDVLASNNADGTTVPEYAQGLPGKLRAVAGNGRTAGLQAAYGSDRAGSYRAELIGDAETLGIDPAAINAMQRPVLVRVMNQSDITADMGDRTNITKTQKLSPVEQAANDSRRFDVGNLAFDDRGNPTEQSLGGFIASLPVSERGDMLNPDGSVTRQATDRLMAATFKQAYESDELVQLYAQAADPDARAVLAAAADASGVMASLKGAGQAFDVRSAVTDAVKMAVNASARGLKLSDVIKNTDFDFNPEAYPVAEFLAANIRSPKAMAEGLRRWGQLARQQAQTEEDNSRQGGLLGPAPTMSRAELFSHIGSTYNPTEQSVAPRVQSDGQVPQASLQESPAPLPVPGNYTGAPSATMGTRTEASAGPAFGLKDALAMIRAKKQEAAQAQAQPPIAPVDAVAPESLAPALHGLSESQQDTPVDTAQAWASMPTDQRKAVAAEAGLPPIVSNNIGKAQWEAINPKAQGKLAEVMAAQAQPAQEQEAVPEDAPPALTPYAPADIEQRQAQQTEATRAEAEAAADAQAKPEAAQEEASVKKPGRGVLAKLEAQRAQKQREQEDADASAKAAEQVRNAELVYNAKRRLAAAYRNEPHGGIDEDYETLRGMLEVRANDSDNPNSGMARDVLDSFDDSIANAKLKEGRTQPQAAASEAPTLELTGQTAEEARAQAASQQAEAARKQGETTQAQSEDERKRIAAASVKAADSFELGQDPMDSLTGQKDVFGAMEEAPEPPAWSPESHVQIAADSVANLRKDDVYRLFDELPKEADNFHDLRVHIIGNRPDLAGAVMEAIGEIGMPNRKAATQDDENRLAESKARVLARGQAVKDYLASGGTVRHANQLRVTPLNHPSQIKVSKDGVRMQAGRDKSAPDGVRWAYLTFGEVDQLASQVPGLDPDLAPDFVRGMAEAKLEQQEQQAQAAPKNLKKGIERAQQNAQSAKAAEITTNEGSNRVGKFAYDIEPTSGYMLAEFSSPPTADGLRIGAENAEELKQQIQRAMDTHDASPYLKMRWKRPGAGQVTLVKLVSLPNSADKSELYEVTFSGGGSMRIDAHRMEESAARDSEAASEEGMAKAKIEREAYQKAEEAAKQSEKDQAARAEAFNLEVKRFADSMGYTALRAGSVRAALKRVHNYEGMGIMSALEFMKKMVANGHAPVEHLPVPQGMPQLHETLGMTDEQVSKFKARRLKNDTTPTYTISGFDITKTESDFAKYLQEGIAQAQQNAAQATQQAENLAWVEKSTGYEPARPAGRPYVLKAGELGRATTVAGKFGEKPKFSDMNRYFASPEEAQDWGKANGYLVGSNPYAATQPEATSKTLAQPQRFTLSIPSVFENMPYVASAPVPTDGDVVSSRIITTNTSITKSDLRTLGLGEDKKKIYAWRVSVARWPDGAFSSLIEAMDMDYGRSPKGEVVAYFKLVDNAEAVNRIAPAIAKAALQDWETASKPVQPSVFDAPVDQGASNTPEATGKTLARSAAEKVLGNRFELSENDKEAKNVSAIAGTKDAYITQGGKELHIVEAVANENLKNATTEAIQEALEKRRPGTDAAKRLQAELDNRGGAVAKPASLKEGIAQARANKAGAAQTQYNNGKLDTDPNDMDAAKIERGYSNLSHNLTAKVEMERKWYVDAVQAFHDALAPVAQAEQQAEKLGDLVDAFKADYVQRRNRVLTVAESSYSAAIAGRSKLNTGQVNTRADAWARAEQAFSQWVAEEKEIAKAALLELRTEGQRDADKQSAENKRVTELVEPVVRSILNLGAIDEGQMPGMSRSSFADSASRKMAALHKNGEVAALEQVFEAIDEWDAAHKKPLFTSKSPVWGYRPAPTAKPVQSAKAEALRPALTPAAPVQQAEAAPVVKAPAATVSTNTVFTEDAAAAARARLKKKLGQLNSGLDPEMMMDGITLAGYHIEKGARTFAAYAKAMLADLGDGVKPYLKSWYMGVKYDPRATTFTGMDSAAVVDSADIDALMAQKDEDVPSTDARVERDSQVPAAESAVGDTVSADPGTTAEGVGKVGGRTGGKSGSGQQDGAGVPFGSAPVAGERGDQRVHTGEPVPELAGIIAGTEFSERSGDDGVGGVPPDSIPASKVEATANQPVDRVKAGVEQARANNAPVKLGDIDSIKATLPQLHPGQQDDVQKAEKRFATPDGYGMLFTNGTGTGKTFSGLGVVKRFALQGKTNTLIVVPDDKIANDWIESAKLLGLGASKLESTKDAGNGIVITSYANLGENDALAGRDWDLVVADEVHTLMQAADGTETGYLQNLRAITHHPDGMFTRYSMQNRDKIALLSELTKKRTANTNLINSGDATDADVQSLRTENTRIEKQRSQLIKELDDARKEMNTEVEEKQGAGRTRLVALSATPFAYEKTVDWANGYLFDYKDGYPHNENSTVYNQPTPREYFFQTRFGYRMRYGKLTAPDSNVDSGMMQRQFNGELKKSGALSGRMLDVPHDYDRRFVLVNSAIGNRIDEALEWLNEARRSAAKGDSGASELAGVINEQFKYLQKRYLLEAIKASEAVPIIKQHMALGRKVVVFHDYKKGGASNPFKVSPIPIRAGAEPSAASVQFNQAIESFNDKFADLINHPLLEGADSPIEVFSRELPGTLFVNGNEKKADLLARYKSFQDDATGPQVMLVQSAKNKGWSGHDTTGKHQRVLINLGQPTAPTMAVQQEGRIYRTGQASDAIMRYMNTGTNWERWTFASTIASRASTAENLGMGEQARALKDSFINAFEQSDTYAPGHEGEGKGGKDQDAAANNALTEYDRAKSLYFANQKKTSKTKAAEGVDYFATPEPVGLKMVEWLDVRSGEDVLEPSGGHGAIARWFPEKSNKTVIEPSLALRSRLALAMNAQEDRLLDGTFEEHNVVNKYDGIVMNPPFGVGGKTAIEHLAKAATHLRDGGRIVALIPTGPAADKRFEQWMYGESDRPTKPLYVHPKHGPIYKGDTVETGASWAPVAIVKNYSVQYGVAVYAPENPSDVTSVNASAITKVKPTGKRTERYSPTVGLHTVANIKLPTATFNRAGTAVATRIVVIEKQSKQENAPAAATRQIDLSGIEKISELFDRLEDMRLPVRPKADAAEDAPQKPPAKTAATARAEKAKAQTAKAGAAVKLGGKDYEVAIYTTNAGKELRGVWMATRTEAEAFTNSPFQKRPLGWFVRESNFPAGAVQQAESQSQPADAPSRSRQQSPATPATPIATVRSALTQAYGKLADQLEQRGLVTVVQTQEQAIEAAAQARAAKTGQSVEQAKRELMDSVDVKRSADGNVQGFFDPQSGQAFLVADHLTAEAAPGVLMHEVGIHMAADKTLAPLFNRAKLMLSMQKNDPFMQRVKAKMDAAGETSGEEVAAYMVEEYERSRANAPASVARWLSDLLATVKAWMHRKGIIGADGLTVADIAAVARANAKSLAQGQVGQQSNADIRFSRTAAAINASTGTLTPKQQQANDRVFGLAKEPTLKEQFDSLKANFGLKARQALVDQFAAIKQLDPKAYMLARMSKASDGTLEASMLYGIPFLNNGVPDVKIGDGGFANVLASLNGEHYRFMKWVAAQRAERLKAEGKENLMTNDDISALKTLNQGQMPDGRSRVLVYGSAMDKLNAYNEAMLKMAMESGHIDQDTFNVMKDQPYVPFYRIMEDEKFQGPKSSSALVNQKAWHKLKGGTNQLNADLLQNMLMNWSHLLQASARNRAALATMDEAEKMAIAYQVPATTKGAVRVMRDGFAEHWMVEDPHLLEAVGALNYTVSPLMKPLTKMKQILTMAVTVNPTFKIRNLIRDSVSAIAQSELSYNPVANVAKGWKLTASDSQIYASMLAGGGLIKFGTQENTDRLRLQIEKLGGQVLNKTTAQGLMDRASKAWDAYSEFGDRTENVNRVALYDKLRKMGRSHAEASFESRDLMDFSMGGTMPLVRFLTQTVPFLNARLVGLDKLGRAAVADPRKFGTMAAAVAIASVALMMMYGDDDDWKKREDWDRDAYWWFKIGGTAFRIPKPFEVGAIGTMAERTFELMFEKEMTNKRFRERIAHMFSQTFAFDPVPQAVKPLLDVYSNKDSFTKRAIESQSDQRMRPQDRYNERTSEVARMLGKLGLPEPSQLIKGEYVGLSPKQIDHLIKGYFSWVGVTATAAADAVIRPAMGKGERPDMRLKDMFMVGNFVETLPTGSSRYVTQMYEQARQINQAYASYREALKSGEVEKAKDIKAANIERFRNRLVFDHAQEQLSKLNQQAKKIEASRAMTGEEKRQRLTDIEQRRGAIAQRVSGRIAA